ncbi:hypothetical protein, partial [Salmonella enterica]|uniref:hypothetical protein n=1 Tax=Salmonella enterica TaxID=28901 RepID=UPI0020C2CE4A
MGRKCPRQRELARQKRHKPGLQEQARAWCAQRGGDPECCRDTRLREGLCLLLVTRFAGQLGQVFRIFEGL